MLSTKKNPTIAGLNIEAGRVAVAEVGTNGASALTGSGVLDLPPGIVSEGEVGAPAPGLGSANLYCSLGDVTNLAVDSGGKKAAFAVSSRVGGNSGDGSCPPDGPECAFLILRKGEAQRLDYELDGRTYRIKLLEIKQVLEDTGIVIESTVGEGS